MTQPLKILMLSESTYPRHPGGAGKCSHQLAAGLVARNHIVHLVSETADTSTQEWIDGVQVHRLQRLDTSRLPPEEVEQATSLHFLTFLEREFKLDSFDLVHDSGGFLSYFFALDLALKETYGLPLVLHFRYLMVRHRILETPTGQLDLLAENVLGFESLLHIHSQGFPVRFADRIVALSRDDADFIREQYRPDSGRLVVLPDAIIPQELSTDAVAMRRHRLAEPGRPLIFFGGRIGDERFKGTDVVLEAFRLLLEERPDCSLVLATKDEDVVGTFRDNFPLAVVDLGWIENARELAEVLAAVDVVWMPSRYEPFGLMCAEAMAVGTPVVAAPTGGLREIIEHGRTGLLLTTHHAERWPSELAAYTAELLASPERRRAMGQEARRYALEELRLERVVERMENLYHDILASPTPAALGPPAWVEADSAAYLSSLEALAGPATQNYGLAVLNSWPSTAADRCRACIHSRMASSIQALGALGRARAARTLRGARWREQLAQAVADVCPLALRQKELASRKSYATGPPDLRAST